MNMSPKSPHALLIMENMRLQLHMWTVVLCSLIKQRLIIKEQSNCAHYTSFYKHRPWISHGDAISQFKRSAPLQIGDL